MSSDRDLSLSPSQARSPLLLALVLYLLWTGATYLLEGRIETLLRPEAVADRLVYALAANLLIGIGGAVWVARRWAREAVARPERIGFRTLRHAAMVVPVGLLLGLVSYRLAGAPLRDPVVLLNGFAQVLPVSAAEVLVCWAVVGGAVEATLHARPAALRVAGAILASSLLFGLYHYAHSPPFNTFAMVIFLMTVGLATGLFFFASRDVYGTVVFHNFLAAAGVLQAMGDAGTLSAFTRPQPHLLGMAALSMTLVAGLHRLSLRSAGPPRQRRTRDG